MSGPHPGYPQQPEPDGWWSGGTPDATRFPTVGYPGPSGGWGEPPRRPPRSTGRAVVAVVSVLVIVAGVATGIVLLRHRHREQQAAPPPPPPAATATTSATIPSASAGLPNGATDLTLSAGQCATAVVDSDGEYRATTAVTCGTPDSDLVLDRTAPTLAGCPDHQYLRLTNPAAGVDCFTLDVAPGDCVNDDYLKTPCVDADLEVLATEPGPGGDNSCTTTSGATHWVPIGRDPVRVGCLGPPS